jgi:hypothetical protein
MLFKMWILVIINFKVTKINTSNCLIHSEKNKFEYLYTRSDEATNVCTSLLSKIDDFERINWNFIPAGTDKHGVVYYFINNKKTNELLCGTYTFKTISNARRSVYLMKNNSNIILLEKCLWNLINLESRSEIKNKYYIINTYFQELLYSEINLFFNLRSNYRNVYLWSWRITNSLIKGFIWSVDCEHGSFLFE